MRTRGFYSCGHGNSTPRINSKFRLPKGRPYIKSQGYPRQPGGDRDTSQPSGVCRDPTGAVSARPPGRQEPALGRGDHRHRHSSQGRHSAPPPGPAGAPGAARLVAPARGQSPLRGATITRPGTWLKHEIPIRTFTEWDDARPGFLEVDLVAHCGTSTEGFYLCTLCAVDIASSWVELQAVWGKGQRRVGTAVHHVRQRLPVPLVGLDSDNGSEVIKPHLFAW